MGGRWIRDATFLNMNARGWDRGAVLPSDVHLFMDICFLGSMDRFGQFLLSFLVQRKVPVGIRTRTGNGVGAQFAALCKRGLEKSCTATADWAGLPAASQSQSQIEKPNGPVEKPVERRFHRREKRCELNSKSIV